MSADLLRCDCDNSECTTHAGRCNRAAHWSQRVYGRQRLPKGYITEDVPVL